VTREEDAGAAARPGGTFDAGWDSGVKRVVMLASGLIVLSIVLIGSFVYAFTEREAVNKLKTRDLHTLASSISAKADGKLGRAMETSLALASDPAVLAWLASGERDERLGRMVHERTAYVHKELGYSTTFIVNVENGHYWNQEGRLLETVDRNDPDDTWFFETVKAGEKAAFDFDYNKQLGDTYAFVNVLAGDDVHRPLGIVGVAMKLDELSAEFASYKDGQGINLWLVDGAGDIYLSDDAEHNGKNIRDVLPNEAYRDVTEHYGGEPYVTDYEAQGRGRVDLIRYPLQTTELQLLVEVERSETIGFLRTIRWNAMFAAAATLLAVVFVFFYVSRKLANPYKRAVELNRRLEAQVEARTKELSERNQEMLDSISYALLLQQSVLPKESELNVTLPEPFVIWRPRDVVGGDFYWVRRQGERTLVAVGDCTGHGVPGAFMAMLAVSTLDRIVDADEDGAQTPADILERLHKLMKETLRQGDEEGLIDDGAAIGLCAVGPANDVTFAGASCLLYRQDEGGIASWKGDRKGVGYRRTPADYRYTNHEIPGGDARIYMSTDGFFDQNGGERNYSFGKKRYERLLSDIRGLPPAQQRAEMIGALETYMQGERQRDDITVLSFRIGAAG